MTFFQRNWLKFSVWLSKTTSQIHMPFSRKKITGKHYYQFAKIAEAGLILVTKTEGELANLGVPGFWGHVAIVNSPTTVVEATTHGVVETDLVTFFMGKDHIMALKPRFATSSQMLKAAQLCREQLGKDYDFEFASSDISKFYCSELITWAYNKVCPNFPFKTREVMGRDTVLPSDFPNASDKWAIVWASSKDVVDK